MNEYIQYCTGCGLCNSVLGTELESNNGFLRPRNISEEDASFFKNVCLYNGRNVKPISNHDFWGNYSAIYEGYSNDIKIRHAASTGGILTAVCIYLISNHLVDGVIQVCENKSNPVTTTIAVSRSVEDVLRCTGSRYCHSAPLLGILQSIVPFETYAFVGKPCDVIILKNYMETYKNLLNIKYTLSFFCAGTPSQESNMSLISSLGETHSNIRHIQYRGNGWPGKYIIETVDHRRIIKDYIQVWMNYLGRDVQAACRFCFDGIGEASDISCGDYWTLSEQGIPVFNETDGINVIFAWTEKGKKILEEMHGKKNIVVSPLQETDRLDKCQPHHLKRRSTMFACTVAMRCLLKKSPRYRLNSLVGYGYKTSIKTRISYFKGIISRSLRGKLK